MWISTPFTQLIFMICTKMTHGIYISTFWLLNSLDCLIVYVSLLSFNSLLQVIYWCDKSFHNIPYLIENFQTAIWMHHMDAYETAGEEAGRKLHKNVESSIKQVLATTPHETPTIRTLAPHHKNYTSSTNQTRRTLLEKQGRAHKRCTPVDPHSWMCKSGTTSTNLHTAAMWGHGL